MSDHSTDDLRNALAAAVSEAHRARIGLPAVVEQHARDFAKAQRESGVLIERLIVEVKELVRRETAGRDSVFMPKIIGWTVAGYFAGTERRDKA